MGRLDFRFAVLLGVGLLLSACQNDDRTSSTPATGAEELSGAGFSQEGLDAIQEMMDTAVADRRISAAVAMLARDGEIVWLGTTGEMEPGVPMRDDPIMPLASVGKMFTATAAMILYERGVVSFDDPVSKYIPEFADVMIGIEGEDDAITLTAPETPITVYHLLTHTSGLTVTGDKFWEAWDTHTGSTTTTHFARALAAMPLFAQPGTQFQYGQTGAAYEVLGAVIEIASGQTLEVFMTENIFEPLGLDDSYFYLPDEKSDRMPATWRMEDGALQLDRQAGEDFPRTTFFHGGGGVRTAPDDILRFTRLFLEGGAVDGVRILKEETVAMMMSDQLGEKTPDRWKPRGLSWGFGAAVTNSEEDLGSGTPGKYGWVGGGFAKLWIDPKKRMIAYINFPMDPPGDNDLLGEFEERVYSALTQSNKTP